MYLQDRQRLKLILAGIDFVKNLQSSSSMPMVGRHLLYSYSLKESVESVCGMPCQGMMAATAKTYW